MGSTLLLFGVLLAAAMSSGQQETAAPISLEALFADPGIHSPCISPDGKRLGLVHVDEAGQHVMTQPLGGGRLVELAKLRDPALRIRALEWVAPDRLLARVSTGTTERLVSIGLGDGSARPLPHSEILSRIPRDADHVVVAVPGEDGVSAARMHVKSGAVETIQAPVEGVVAWHADPMGRIRAGSMKDAVLLRSRSSAPFERVDGVAFAAFGATDEQFMVFADSALGRRGVYLLALPEPVVPGFEVYAHPEYDVDAIEHDALEQPIGARYVAEALPKTFYFKPDVIRERLNLDHELAGTWNEVVSASLDGERQLIRASADARAPRMVLYHRAKQRADEILRELPGVADTKLARTLRAPFAARDGATIPAFLTLPPGGAKKQLPLIVLVHDGPRARDDARFDPRIQAFASRGFAIFQIQYRGSSGYGRSFEQAGLGEWGRGMQQDIEDGVRWLVGRGIADSRRIGIYGAGYGGYVAIQALVASPDLFAAGASFGGVFDLEVFLDPAAPTLRAGAHEAGWHDYVLGGAPRNREALRAISPLHQSKAIRAPVFLAHGNADARVADSESRRLAEALGQRAHAVTWLSLADEDGSLATGANRLALYGGLVAFFGEHLAPPAPPGLTGSGAAPPSTD